MTTTDKQRNRQISQVRVRVEHALAGVKRNRIVKDTLRNTKDGLSDRVMAVSSALHNLRTKCRKHPLKL